MSGTQIALRSLLVYLITSLKTVSVKVYFWYFEDVFEKKNTFTGQTWKKAQLLRKLEIGLTLNILQLHFNRLIGLVGRVFANGPGGLGSSLTKDF